MTFWTEKFNPDRPNPLRMSAPPPGGSPPPQSPPQYPPQYPPQGYPPQYPPQQPYYAQPAPPPKKSNTVLIIVLVLVIVVVVVAAMAWWVVTSLLAPVNNATNFTITAVSLTIDYPGSLQYFGASPITSCSTCPIHGTIVSGATYTFSLTNGDSVPRNITSIVLTGIQFQLVSTVPTLSSSSPMVFTAGQTRSITLNIEGIGLGGSGTLTGTITTT